MLQTSSRQEQVDSLLLGTPVIKKPGRPRGTWTTDPVRNLEITQKYQTCQYTMGALGQEYGMTRERIRQIINLVDPSVIVQVKEKRKAARLKRQEQVLALKKEKTIQRLRGKICLTCWKPLLVALEQNQNNAIREFCSGACRRMFDLTRYQLDSTRRDSIRRGTANYILKRADSTPEQRKLAEKILSGAELKSQGRWVNSTPNNQTRTALKNMRVLRAENAAKYGMPENPPFPFPDHIFPKGK